MLAGMLAAGVIGCAVVPPVVARAGAERRDISSGAIVWVAGCCGGLAVVHPVVVADYVLIAAIGFVLLAALPVILELTERRMGASGGVATGVILLVGNLGGLLVAVLVGVLVDLPAVAFVVLGSVALLGLPAARQVVGFPRRSGREAAVSPLGPSSVPAGDPVGPRRLDGGG